MVRTSVQVRLAVTRSRNGWHMRGHLRCLLIVSPCPPQLSPPPIGLTAAVLFAGGKVPRDGSRVRSPGTFTCAGCPAVTAVP